MMMKGIPFGMMMMMTLVLSTLLDVTTAERTGHIVSCPAWTLNRHQVLKQFLKGGEVEEYEGVTIEWIRGT